MTSPSQYAADLGRENEEAIAFARSCSPEQWTAVVPGENWPVCVVVHHVAKGYELVSRWIDCALVGDPIEDTADGIDADNLCHAEDFGGVGVAETVDLLRTNGAAAVAKLGRLSQSDLLKTAAFGPAGGQPFTVEQFCVAAAGHVRSHLGHARAALGQVSQS
jgi:DinB superfamily